MKFRVIPAIGAVLVAVATMLTPAAAQADSVASPYIYGGTIATKPYPAEASVYKDFGDGTGPHAGCGATHIGDLWGHSIFALAAHCVTPEGSSTPSPAAQFSLGTGSNDRREQTSHAVSAVGVAPGWSWSQPRGIPQRDFAEMITDRIVPVPTARIAPAHVGEHLVLVGWGRTTRTGTGPQSQVLEQLDATVLPSSECAWNSNDGVPGITPGDLCMGSASGTGICPGDSGSAAFNVHDNLIGIASRTPGVDPRCDQNRAVYTGVANYALTAALLAVTLIAPPGLTPAQQVEQAERALSAAGQ